MRSVWLIPVVLLVACDDEPIETDGLNVARLAIQALGSVGGEVTEDAVCGFESAAAKASRRLIGQPGQMGEMITTISGCTLDFTATPAESADCDDVKTILGGRVIVDATLRLRGRLTGDDDDPVLPEDPEASTLELTNVIAEGLVITRSDNDTRFELREGSMSGTIQARLAANNDGACLLPTPNARLSTVTLDKANLFVGGDGESAYVFVPESNLSAQVGRGTDMENQIWGTIDLFTERVALAGKALDPNYERMAFEDSYAKCEDDLAKPVKFTCDNESTDRDLADGIGRGTVGLFSSIVALLNDDTNCGFESPGVEATVVITGAAGGMGTATYRTTGCVLDYTSTTTVSTDCDGVSTIARGRVTVTARRTVTGRLTGRADTPVLPVVDTPARIEIDSAVLDGFRISSTSTDSDDVLEFRTGLLSGAVTPRLARSRSDEACSIATPIARIENLRLSDSTVAIETDDGTLVSSVASANIGAVNGTFSAGESNVLTGTITIGGKTRGLPAMLDDDFSQAVFDRKWQSCESDLQVPVSYVCDPIRRLVDGAARLTPQMMGLVVALTENDDRCGFSTPSIAQNPTSMDAIGDDGTAVFTIASSCRISFPQPIVANDDCNDVQTLVSGTFNVRGEKRVRGFITGDPSLPVIPTTRDSVSYELFADLANFRVASTSTTVVGTIVSGQLSGTVAARSALDTATDTCTKPTPLFTFSDLTYANAVVRLQNDDGRFDVTVSASDIDAQTGAANSIAAALTVGGMQYVLTDALDPSFDQAEFDRSFACDSDLQVVTDDAVCAFREPLAEGIARLTISKLATAAVIALNDQRCGFSAPQVLGMPLPWPTITSTNGLQFFINTCQIDVPMATELQRDCQQNATFAEGRLTATGTRAVGGVFFMPQQLVPVTPTNTMIGISELRLNDFTTYSLRPGQTTVSTQLQFVGGTASYWFNPVAGEDAMIPGVFDQATPVAEVGMIEIDNAPVSLRTDGRTFNVRIDSASLEAFIGTFGNRSNELSGTITLDGQTFDLGMIDLDPTFNQTTFDLGYVCNPQLRAPVR